MSEAGDQYFELEKKLLANEEAGDAIRDAMDGPWYEMTEEERDKANKLGPEYWNQYKKPLKVAEETVAEIDDALRAGADEELWPPGKTRGEAVAAIIERVYKQEAQLTHLREATCGKCGRSLAPDGDCYGCEADRLRATVARVREGRDCMTCKWDMVDPEHVCDACLDYSKWTADDPPTPQPPLAVVREWLLKQSALCLETVTNPEKPDEAAYWEGKSKGLKVAADKLDTLPRARCVEGVVETDSMYRIDDVEVGLIEVPPRTLAPGTRVTVVIEEWE